MKLLSQRIIEALKWSALAEMAVKLATPVATMILARILTPDAFGLAAVATAIVSLAEIISDSGFQKFIIRHSFPSVTSLYSHLKCALGANLLLAFALTLILCIFSRQLAAVCGLDGHAEAIWLAALSLPATAASGVHASFLKRRLLFNRLFKARALSASVPILITIPLALILRSHIAIIGGLVASSLLNAIVLASLTPFRIKPSLDLSTLRSMAGFSLWSTFEAVLIWLTLYIDLFIVGNMLDTTQLGIYRTAIVTTGQILGLITASLLPVLYSSLSEKARDNNPTALPSHFFSMQRMAAVAVVPAGCFIFLFSDQITLLLLGSQWTEASYFISLWGLTSIPVILVSHFSSEAFRAVGNPRLSVISQGFQIISVLVALGLSCGSDFDTLCLVRSLARLPGVGLNIFLLHYFCGIKTSGMFSGIPKPSVR